MIKLITSFLIRLLFYANLTFLILIVLPYIIPETKDDSKYKDSYVSIETKYYPAKTITKVLEEFNKKGDGKIVHFNANKDSRIIIIKDINRKSIVFNALFPDTVGFTYPGYNRCIVYIRSDLDKDTLRTTIFHEYLHCFGYEHVDKKDDLMYYDDNGLITENSINGYAKDLEKKYGK